MELNAKTTIYQMAMIILTNLKAINRARSETYLGWIYWNQQVNEP